MDIVVHTVLEPCAIVLCMERERLPDWKRLHCSSVCPEVSRVLIEPQLLVAVPPGCLPRRLSVGITFNSKEVRDLSSCLKKVLNICSLELGRRRGEEACLAVPKVEA